MANQPTSRFAPKPARLSNDTTIHVAQLLQEVVGAARQARVALDGLPLDEDALARGVEAEIKLTRIPAGILAAGEVAATVTVPCIRCLEDAAVPVRTDFADEYRPTVDVMSGAEISPEEANEHEAEYFTIGGDHVLDLRESLRQAIILGLPMAPLCREDCPGLAEAVDGAGDPDDGRLAVLGRLLDGGEAGDAVADDGRKPARRTGS